MNSNSRPAPDLSAMLRGRDPLAPFRITLDVHSVFDQAGLLDLQESDLVNCGRREAWRALVDAVATESEKALFQDPYYVIFDPPEDGYGPLSHRQRSDLFNATINQIIERAENSEHWPNFEAWKHSQFMEEEVYARWKEVEGNYISAFGKTVERALADHGVDRFAEIVDPYSEQAGHDHDPLLVALHDFALEATPVPAPPRLFFDVAGGQANEVSGGDTKDAIKALTALAKNTPDFTYDMVEILATVAANVGSIDQLLPNQDSPTAASLRDIITNLTGTDTDELLQWRTEPIHIYVDAYEKFRESGLVERHYQDADRLAKQVSENRRSLISASANDYEREELKSINSRLASLPSVDDGAEELMDRRHALETAIIGRSRNTEDPHSRALTRSVELQSAVEHRWMDLEEEYVLKVKSTVEDLVAERGLSHLPVEVENSRWRGDNSHTHDQLAVELHQAALARTPLPDPDSVMPWAIAKVDGTSWSDSYLEHRGTEGGGGHLGPDPYAPDATEPSAAPQVRQVLGPDL
ncbi:hypothetical protein AB6N35_00360 [Dietzia cinnamea]|uniref:Uncharacterized protein n=3 Tax=Dietzia cinnamea TaxID=321318 RepID=A0ABV3YE45_9ACTN|nr:hypothetical protein [Dietzia cinnamea]MCT2235121.1 hypothetical protein [Dietzia cinnamea]